MIHTAIHIARPDILCAAHTHSIHGKAFSSLGIEIEMISQDVCAFYDVSAMKSTHSISRYFSQDVALYTEFNGVVLAQDEGKHIAEALGNKKVDLIL